MLSADGRTAGEGPTHSCLTVVEWHPHGVVWLANWCVIGSHWSVLRMGRKLCCVHMCANGGRDESKMYLYLLYMLQWGYVVKAAVCAVCFLAIQCVDVRMLNLLSFVRRCEHRAVWCCPSYALISFFVQVGAWFTIVWDQNGSHLQRFFQATTCQPSSRTLPCFIHMPAHRVVILLYWGAVSPKRSCKPPTR